MWVRKAEYIQVFSCNNSLNPFFFFLGHNVLWIVKMSKWLNQNNKMKKDSISRLGQTHFSQHACSWSSWCSNTWPPEKQKKQIEPRHDKTNKVTVRPAKTQISLGI